MNQHYIKNSDPKHVARHLSHHLGRLGVDPAPEPPLEEVVKAQRERARTLVEMAQNSRFFYCDLEGYDEKAARKHLGPDARPALAELRERLGALRRFLGRLANAGGAGGRARVAADRRYGLAGGPGAYPGAHRCGAGPRRRPCDLRNPSPVPIWKGPVMGPFAFPAGPEG